MLLMGSCRRLTRDTSRNEKDDGWGWSSKTAGLLLTAMGTGITLPAWTAKTLDRIHEMTASEVGQRATSERKEHESESCDCPAWGLVAASTQQHKRRNPNGAYWSHHIEEIEIRVHGARIFMAEYWRQGACAESALEICRRGPLTLADLQICGVKLHKTEKRTNGKQQAEQFVELTQSRKEFTFPPARVERPHNTQGTG